MITPPPKPEDRRILFIDMNSFFASVEQQANPRLRGIPIGIAPIDAPSACVIAASIEAKKLGVGTGTLVREAKKIIPKIKMVVSTPNKYLSVHRKLISILEKFSPELSMLSIDEAFLVLDKNLSAKDVAEIAHGIKKEITKFGDWLKASIGVAPNVFLAKAAAESKKPDGYTELLLKDLPKFFAEVPSLMEIKGIKRGMAHKLWAVDINTPLEFFNANAQYLRTSLGIIGELWHLRLHGYRVDELLDRPPKSIGHQHVLAPEFRTPERAVAVMRKLVERAAKRLRNHNMYARGVSLTVSYLKSGYLSRSRRVEPFKDSLSFWQNIWEVFEPLPREEIMMIAVSAWDLFDAPPQLKLFPEDNRKTVLSELMDKINDRYGEFVIRPALMRDVDGAAEKRIPFGKIRY